MSDHALVEGLAGLASRVDALSHLTEGDDSRTLEEQEDRLAKLTLVAIALDMDATNAKYKDAVNRVQGAIDAIGDGDKRIRNVAVVISKVAKALDVAEKLITKLPGVRAHAPARPAVGRPQRLVARSIPAHAGGHRVLTVEAAQKEFEPACVYVNTASIGLPPRRVVDALDQAIDTWRSARAEAADYDALI